MSDFSTAAAQRQAVALIEHFGLRDVVQVDEVAQILQNLRPGDLVNETEVSIAFGPAVRTLRNWRSSGSGGPPFIKIGHRMVRYVLPLVPAWIELSNKRKAAA